jgi:alkanesulfonate monooxygenase SsuD/methylene tetrahydromethanopterin reductase-like flavin-dependent oxidoreductase (luciferase family)
LHLALGTHPPDTIATRARQIEELGFGGIWVAEGLEEGYINGAIATAALVLGATDRIPLGFATVSAVVRHPAVLAMEFAALAGAYPGRFMPGVGLGWPGWLAQLGLEPESQLAAVRECCTSLRALLAGEQVDSDGPTFVFKESRLAYPVSEPMPIYAGVSGPKMLQLAGAFADATAGPLLASPAYIRWAREQIAMGQESAGRGGERHPFASCAHFWADEDEQRALDTLRPIFALYLSWLAWSPIIAPTSFAADAIALAEQGYENLRDNLPDEWMRELCVVGTPETCAAQVNALLEAGADYVILYPTSTEGFEQTLELAAALIPQVG